MEMKTFFAVSLLVAVVGVLSGCGMDSTTGNYRGGPCRDEVPPSTGSLLIQYSNPSNFDTVVISLHPRGRGGLPYDWSPKKGTRSDVVKGLGFVKYWVTARYVRNGDTVDVFDSETIENGESTNSAGCKVYNPLSSINVEVERWPR